MITEHAKNVLLQVKATIQAYPIRYDHRSVVNSGADCGTTYCIAGFVCLLHGDTNEHMYMPRAAYHLGVNQSQPEFERLMDILFVPQVEDVCQVASEADLDAIHMDRNATPQERAAIAGRLIDYYIAVEEGTAQTGGDPDIDANDI